jgi:hypothetical protein
MRDRDIHRSKGSISIRIFALDHDCVNASLSVPQTFSPEPQALLSGNFPIRRKVIQWLVARDLCNSQCRGRITIIDHICPQANSDHALVRRPKHTRCRLDACYLRRCRVERCDHSLAGCRVASQVGCSNGHDVRTWFKGTRKYKIRLGDSPSRWNRVCPRRGAIHRPDNVQCASSDVQHLCLHVAYCGTVCAF